MKKAYCDSARIRAVLKMQALVIAGVLYGIPIISLGQQLLSVRPVSARIAVDTDHDGHGDILSLASNVLYVGEQAVDGPEQRPCVVFQLTEAERQAVLHAKFVTMGVGSVVGINVDGFELNMAKLHDTTTNPLKASDFEGEGQY